MNLHVDNVDQIFQTHNIYKSVLVCDKRRLTGIKKTLLSRDFPVATIDRLAKFVTSNDRILLLSPDDANNLDLILGDAKHVRDQLSALICVQDTKFVPSHRYWEGIPLFFV